MTTLSGACLCGAVTFACDGEVQRVLNRHCDDSREATGAVPSTPMDAALPRHARMPG